MKEEKFRVPRKLKKKIPKGLYCYTGINFDYSTGIYHTKPCPFFEYKKHKDIPINQRPDWMDDEYVAEFGEESDGWCKLLKFDIDDQCKSCGLKTNF